MVAVTTEINLLSAVLREGHVLEAVHNQPEMHSLIQLQVGRDSLKLAALAVQVVVAVQE